VSPSLGGRTALVTGGGWNIGRATAVAFARAGARVTVCGRNEERLAETVAAIEADGGSALAVRAVLPGMREHGGGTIVTCTGGGAWFPMTDTHATAYATAKAGICRLTDQLAVELLGTGIRVNCLQPGLTWSAEREREIEAEERRTGRPHPQRASNHSPEDGAELALWLASEASEPLTGRSVSVDEDWWRDPKRVRSVAASHHAACLRRIDPE